MREYLSQLSMAASDQYIEQLTEQLTAAKENQDYLLSLIQQLNVEVTELTEHVQQIASDAWDACDKRRIWEKGYPALEKPPNKETYLESLKGKMK